MCDISKFRSKKVKKITIILILGAKNNIFHMMYTCLNETHFYRFSGFPPKNVAYLRQVHLCSMLFMVHAI